MVLTVSETDTLLIYENGTLKWSARLSLSPMSVHRAFFPGMKGALVFLSEDGSLRISYLGTEPVLFTAPPLVNKNINFEKAEEELATLNKIIRTNKSSGMYNLSKT